jgi:His/Glu/Gln/Arg/opine family amino acid ABC transporter permease subunit
MVTLVAQSAFRWDLIWDNLGLFLDGVRLTIFISMVAFVLASVGGLIVALLRMSRSQIVKPIMATYINIFRAIPLLVFILFVYYGITISFDLRMSAIQAGILALTLQYSAWLGEIFRSGIQAVPSGQREAAHSVGMGRIQTFIQVVLPQAARIVIPSTGNMFIGMVKDSSLVYLIGVPELLRVSNRLANRTFRYFEVYFTTVVIYLVLTTAIYYGVKYLENRFTLVDVLSVRVRRLSPFTRRRAARLRRIQESIRSSSQAERAAATADDQFAPEQEDLAVGGPGSVESRRSNP